MSFHDYRWPWVAAAAFLLFLIPFRVKGFSSLGSATRFWLGWLLASVILGVSTAGSLTRGHWNGNLWSQRWAQPHWQIEFWLWTILPLALGFALDAAKGFQDWSRARAGFTLGLALGPLASRALPWEAWLAMGPVAIALALGSALIQRRLPLKRGPLWPLRGLIALNLAFLLQGLVDPPSRILSGFLFVALALAYGPGGWRWSLAAAALAWAASLARDHSAWPPTWWPPVAPVSAMILGWALPLLFARSDRAAQA